MPKTLRQLWPISTCALVCIFLGSAVGSTIALAAPAGPYTIPTKTPESLKEIEKEIEKIEQNIEKAECGGVVEADLEESHMAEVIGLPGHKAEIFGHIDLGMAKRIDEDGLLDNGFLYPKKEDASGWSTLCRPGTPPYYKDSVKETPCKTPQECARKCENISRWQYPLWICNRRPRRGPCGQHGGQREAGLPANLYYANPGDDPEREPRMHRPGGDCRFIGWFYCCSNARVTEMRYDRCRNNPANCYRHDDPMRNCIRCEGDGAAHDLRGGNILDYNQERLRRRTEAADGGTDNPRDRNETGCRVGRSVGQQDFRERDAREVKDNNNNDKQIIIPRQFTSFFREYKVSYTRDPIPDKGGRPHPNFRRDDRTREDMPVQCYGRYTEFDTKDTVAKPKDYHCLIDTTRNDHDYDKMEDTQKAKGDIKPKRPYDDPAVEDQPRNEKAAPLWFQEIGDAFSMLDGKKLKKDHENDLTVALLNLDNGRQRSTVQMNLDAPISSGALLSAFDDTVAFDDDDPEEATNPKRTIVEWWHEQQTAMHTLFTPPVARLLLPPAWSVDLDPLHPLLAPRPVEETLGNLKENPILQPLEVQLEIREDLLGEVAQYLRDSLIIDIVQEEIPVVVPLGSPTDFRAIYAGWCHWHKVQNDTDNCDDAGEDLGKLLNELEEYADHIEDYREIRAESTALLARYLEMHNTINRSIGRWVLDNAKAFVQYKEDREQQFDLREDWREVQEVYREFHDKTNMPWCKNDRYTTPIYSLLDPWLKGRPDLTGEELPRLEVERQPDVVFDFTFLKTSTGGIKIPVLKPIQVSYDLEFLRPPAEHAAAPSIPKLPKLPAIPNVRDRLEELGPQVQEIAPKPLVFPPPNIVVLDAEDKFEEMKEMMEEMMETYTTFWDGVKGRKRECPKPNDGRCVHTEMDLTARMQRIAARPAVYFLGHTEGLGEFREPHKKGYQQCDTRDWACQLLNEEHTRAREGWEVDVPPQDEEDALIYELRDKGNRTVEIETPPSAGGEDPFRYTEKYEDILPSFNHPNPVVPSFEPE